MVLKWQRQWPQLAGGSRPVPIDAPLEKWEEGMMLDFFRLRELTHAVIPGMISRRWGRIINITGTSEPRGINVANSAKAAGTAIYLDGGMSRFAF